MGVHGNRAEQVETYLREAVEAHGLPGAVYHVEGPGGPSSAGAIGAAALEPERVPARAETLYDLASVTKSAATALLAVLADREGVLPLEGPLAGVLPDLLGSPWEETSPEDFLLHRSGLPAWAPLYCLANTKEEVAAVIARLTPNEGPAGAVLYSDLGPILVGLALENAWDEELGALFQERIAGPLRMRDTLFRPGRDLLPRIAPTERGNEREQEMAREWPDACGRHVWPDRLLHGEVHDGNARFLGHAAGHAGLFGTAAELAALGREVLGPDGPVLGPEERRRLLAPYLPPEGEPRCLFGQTSAGPDSPASSLGEGAAGHTGFTGTSLFVDPQPRAVFVLLSNRVHPHDRPDVPMNTVRRDFHALAAAALASEVAQ
jgi:CubicO group peptidase (beta-lactamase class C family)